MQAKDDIFRLLLEKSAEVVQKAQCGLIVQPGAIGDCILTLPVARFMKDRLKLGSVDMLGHMEYISFLPGRSCVDGVRSIDSVPLHRLFVKPDSLELEDKDPLIDFFAGYTWIVSFLAEPDSNFEQNLIFTANCSHSAEVITLAMKPSGSYSRHIMEYYAEQLVAQSGFLVEGEHAGPTGNLIRPGESDTRTGKELMGQLQVDAVKKLVVIQPGSGSVEKCWHLENFLAVARRLAAEGFEVLFLLGPAELERFGEADISRMEAAAGCARGLSLPQVLGLLSCAFGFAGNDSGVSHLAAGLGIRTATVFGPSDSVLYRPVGPCVTVLRDATPDFGKKPSAKLQNELVHALTA
jgi:heptosyltransferase-3